MTQDKMTGATIQAFPVKVNTYISPDTGMTGFDASEFSVLHCYDDGELTFHFRGGNTTIIPAIAGMDYSIGSHCETIDSTIKIGMS